MHDNLSSVIEQISINTLLQTTADMPAPSDGKHAHAGCWMLASKHLQVLTEFVKGT